MISDDSKDILSRPWLVHDDTFYGRPTMPCGWSIWAGLKSSNSTPIITSFPTVLNLDAQARVILAIAALPDVLDALKNAAGTLKGCADGMEICGMGRTSAAVKERAEECEAALKKAGLL